LWLLKRASFWYSDNPNVIIVLSVLQILEILSWCMLLRMSHFNFGGTDSSALMALWLAALTDIHRLVMSFMGVPELHHSWLVLLELQTLHFHPVYSAG